ncbi:MAG: hypothetical protein QOI89_3413 [Solirubrobacteraceae bacterium]|nr:hypothetical protein [Solirubrobacteraceae bacterium]
MVSRRWSTGLVSLSSWTAERVGTRLLPAAGWSGSAWRSFSACQLSVVDVPGFVRKTTVEDGVEELGGGVPRGEVSADADRPGGLAEGRAPVQRWR